jgi:universal stress protein A
VKTETQLTPEAKTGKEGRFAGKAVTEPLPLHWKSILAPTDLSEPSKRAVKSAAALAQKCGAKIILLNVVQMPNCCSSDAPPNVEEMMNIARKSLDEIAQTIPPDVAVEKIVRFGTREPVKQIVEEADKVSADLIVIATHGYSGLKRVLLGGTAERVVRHAPCPVLVVRAPGKSSQPAESPTREP